ncbi:hypothetical protein G9A89_001448 [Geosiphon pyriformis]|nr:hypothetical protein G9A89_001448 [Geosiphon pyriformis]
MSLSRDNTLSSQDSNNDSATSPVIFFIETDTDQADTIVDIYANSINKQAEQDLMGQNGSNSTPNGKSSSKIWRPEFWAPNPKKNEKKDLTNNFHKVSTIRRLDISDEPDSPEDNNPSISNDTNNEKNSNTSKKGSFFKMGKLVSKFSCMKK